MRTQTALTEDQAYEITSDFFDDDVIAYSGRGMSGVECLGIRFDSVEDLVSWAFGMGEESDYKLVRLLARGVKIDDMGRGIVAYWPEIAPVEVEVETDDE